MFDSIEKDDQILAFFPCTRFDNQIYMHFQATAHQYDKWSDERKLENVIRLHNELNHMYIIVSKLAIVCLRKGIPLIIENPMGGEHYLTRYWCLKSKIKDYDRRERGDYFKKPTQYWFINREPSNHLIFENVDLKETKRISAYKNQNPVNNKVERSLIHPDYANRFIREFII